MMKVKQINDMERYRNKRVNKNAIIQWGLFERSLLVVVAMFVAIPFVFFVDVFILA